MSNAYYERLVQEDLNVGTSTTTRRNPGGGTLTGTQVGIHSLAVGQVAASKTWSPGAIAADEAAVTTVTVTGAAVGDFVLVSHDMLSTNQLILTGTVSSAGIVNVVLHNAGSTSVTPASGTLRALVLKSA